jgi:hypothetical protein
MMRVLFVAALLASVGVPVLPWAASQNNTHLLAGRYVVSGQRLCQSGGINLYAGILQFHPGSQTAREEMYTTAFAVGVEHIVYASIPYSVTGHSLTLDGFTWKAAFGRLENGTADSVTLVGMTDDAAPKSYTCANQLILTR